MKILRGTFSRFTMKPVQLFLFSGVTGCWFLAILISVSLVTVDAYAQENGATGDMQKHYRGRLSRERRQEIIEKNAKIRKLQEGIIDHKVKILGSRKEERTLLGELEDIEKKLKFQKNMLATLQTESARQELLLSDKQEYLKQVLTEKRKHQAHVKNRLAAYYRMGSVGLMNVVFSSESLPDLLGFQDYFKLMLQHDNTIIQKYLSQLKESNRAREEHAREKLRLMKLTQDVNNKEQQLQHLREEKNYLLKKVNTEQHLYEQAVAEIEEAVTDLAATLQRLQTAPEPQADAPQPTEKVAKEKKKLAQDTPSVQEGFPSRKGLLDPPVPGIIITRFGQKIKGKFDSSSLTNGIDIRVEKDLEIRAVYDGKVIHSGYLRGYGNLMIIDHGHQYFSLIARAAEFYKNEGTKVNTGEIIGITGEGDPLYGEGLHFEIRKGSTPEDPLLWLKKNSLPVE